MANSLKSLCICLIILWVSSVCNAQTLYEVRDLGRDWWPYAISNNQIVIGTDRSDGVLNYSAVIWRNGQLSVLPDPDLDPDFDDRIAETWAVDISDDGEYICGWVGYNYYQPDSIIWRPNGNTEIINGTAVAINTAGQVAGYYAPHSIVGNGYFYEDGNLTVIGSVGEEYAVNGMNNLGQIVGVSPVEYDPKMLFLWDDGEIYTLDDLLDTNVEFDMSTGMDINDSTQIIGHYQIGSESGSFLYEDGDIQLIRNFSASAINESAHVVGGKRFGGGGFLYKHETGVLTDLNGSIDPDGGWQIIRAADINDEGVIIGRGQLNGNDRAFMLTPCEASSFFYDNDGDGYGDPRETRLACDQPDEYVEADGVEELIINGGMEGDSNWIDWESPVANERTDNRVHQGNYARRLSADDPYDGIRSENFRLRAGTTYRATLWAYGNGRAPLRILVHMNAQNLSQYKPNEENPIPPSRWTRYTWTYTPTTTGNYAFYVELAPDGPTGDFYIDDVSVTQAIASVSDCNDNNDAIHPDAGEICNGIDDDCDGDIDEGVRTTFYRDGDGDGYGNPSDTRRACTAPQGYIPTAGDCDDDNENVHPDAEENCNNIDDDCDGDIDEGVTTTYYRDGDNDGYGDAGNTTQACSPPTGYVANASDCDDTRDAVHPAASETCNGLDDDCDSDIDEGVTTTFYRDVDGDGYGSIQDTTEACAAPSGYVLTAADCDDTRPHIFPGAVETCNGVDDDCDGEVDEQCIVNALPVAEAGDDQQVFEGDTVTLDGSGSTDPDDAIDTWQWVQIAGPPVVLSNAEIVRPTFVTPVVTDERIELTFRLLVTDLKGALATDEVHVSVADNGISGSWIPDDAITRQISNGKAIGFIVLEGGSLVAIKEVASTVMAANGEFPEALIYGPLWLKIRTSNTGDNVKLAVYFQEPITDNHTAFVRLNTDEWVELTEQAVFNTDRTEIKTDLVNGGSMDEDGEDNQFIATTIAIGGDEERDAPEDPGTNGSSGSSGGGGGCFVQLLTVGE